MGDESYSFSTARARLEDIVSEVRKKDTSLEKSLDLLEEGVRLANQCTELIDQQDWTSVVAPESAEGAEDAAGEPEAAADAETAEGGETVVVAEVVEVVEYEVGPEFAEADDAWADESEFLGEEEGDDPSADEG